MPPRSTLSCGAWYEVYGGTAGFDTVDLQEAQAMFASLG